VRNDRARSLLPVPGAVAAQPLGQLLELEDRLVETGAAAQRDYWLEVSVVVVSVVSVGL
jgi:hypothetical protein